MSLLQGFLPPVDAHGQPLFPPPVSGVLGANHPAPPNGPLANASNGHYSGGLLGAPNLLAPPVITQPVELPHHPYPPVATTLTNAGWYPWEIAEFSRQRQGEQRMAHEDVARRVLQDYGPFRRSASQKQVATELSELEQFQQVALVSCGYVIDMCSKITVLGSKE